MQRTENNQVILEEENEMKGLALVGMKSCYEAIIIKRVWYWHKGRQTERPMKENRESRIRYTHVWTLHFWKS